MDVRTGAIRLAALFPNPGNVLRPGQYARVHTAIEVQTGALVVPQKAVVELQGTHEVALIDDNKIRIRTVDLGETVGPEWIVRTGLKPGDRVVVEGLQKVREGMQVSPKLSPRR